MYPTQSKPSFNAPKIALASALCVLLAGTHFALTSATAASATPAPKPVVCPTPGTAFGDYTDANVNVFAGRSITLTGSTAEVEGLVVAMDNLTVDRSGPNLVNIGRAGVGSQITPAAGDLMLAVGGALNNTDDRIEVAALLGPHHGYTKPGAQGGDVAVGGAISNPAKVEVNGGKLEQNLGAAAVAPFASFDEALIATSTRLDALASTGSVSANGAGLRFTGDGSSALQSFTVDASQLRSELYFDKIPKTASVVVNVTGSAASFAPTHFELNGVRSDWAGPLADAAGRFLWNFADAQSVNIGGSTQFVGSILVPTAESTLTMSASGNGRVYVGGHLVVSGQGNELHAYPWSADPLTRCLPSTPTFPVKPEPKPEPKPEQPQPKPEPKPEQPQPKPEPKPEQPQPKPEPKPEQPQPKPEPKPEQPQPKPEPKPEQPEPQTPAKPVPGVVTAPSAPKPTPSPTPAAVAGGAGAAKPLAETGVNGFVGVLSAGLVALLLGGGLVVVRRRMAAKL